MARPRDLQMRFSFIVFIHVLLMILSLCIGSYGIYAVVNLSDKSDYPVVNYITIAVGFVGAFVSLLGAIAFAMNWFRVSVVTTPAIAVVTALEILMGLLIHYLQREITYGLVVIGLGGSSLGLFLLGAIFFKWCTLRTPTGA